MPFPFHDLKDIQAEARSGRARIYPEPALDVVQGRLDMDPDEAKVWILEGVIQLTSDDFWKRDTKYFPPADVYGLIRRSISWYIKVKLAAGKLHVCSFHPPTDSFYTKGGTYIRKGG
jgi:hypothetical protein